MSIPCLVYIRRNTDGEVRCYDNLEWHDDSDYPDFIWSEGNYACDCNRALFFARAIGEDDPERSCGDSAFSLRITDVGGKELYSEFDE